MSWDTDSDFWNKSIVLATFYADNEQCHILIHLPEQAALKHLPSLFLQVIVLFIDFPVPLPLQDLSM